MGMRSFWVLAALAVSVLAGGCAAKLHASPDQDAQAKRFDAPPAGLSRLYIYRSEPQGPQGGLDLSVDGEFAGMTKDQTFVVADVPAGPHELVSVGSNTSKLNLTTQAGESVFIRQEAKAGGFQFALVPAEQGRAAIMGTALVKSALMQRGTPMAGGAAATPVAAAARVALAGSRYAYEAERAAKERGCMGPNGIRPAAQLRAKHGVIEEFEVTCSASVQRVRCDMGMCSAVR